MKIALIGASGFVGSAVLKEALNRGYEVTAIVRNPEKIKIDDKNLKKIKANALNSDEVAQVVKGSDAVINAFNPGWGNPNIYHEALEGSKAIQKGVRNSGVKRLLAIGGPEVYM